mgnify:CR=1 FL=1
MGTNSLQATDSAVEPAVAPAVEPRVESALNEVADRWTESDPPVLAFPGDGMPVVATVRGRLYCLSYRVVDPYPLTRAAVVRMARKRGGPHVVALSEHPAGYEKRLFRVVE